MLSLNDLKKLPMDQMSVAQQATLMLHNQMQDVRKEYVRAKLYPLILGSHHLRYSIGSLHGQIYALTMMVINNEYAEYEEFDILCKGFRNEARFFLESV